ncbi:hypothetical protein METBISCDRAFT_14763 [Metschnikowia bicuspidata]|uniref:Nuclear condensin complex subunit 3 C-terminal domain-containing protein n=1 Tax=Metschnikowia bicuspidata TaxID=27322 RepID=A0A4P9Z7D3_9ASCO|nr:hypothetical protein METBISCDRAFT_20774 [Metschnikowia bicuspidata]RKP31145.1 hypothetical protein METBISCDRAFT_14763 [Metschnikowia bicuspidata]
MTVARPTLKQIEEYDDFGAITNAVSHVFADAQASVSGHRKLVVQLRKIQTRAIHIGHEEQFNFQFTKTVSKMLRLKKCEPSGDRIAKFCSLFVATMVKQESERPTTRPEAPVWGNEPGNGATSDAVQEKENVLCEFFDYLVRHLLRGIESKYKEVRYRIAQLLAYLVGSITEMDEQLFCALGYLLSRRLYDQEATVRIQAVVAMSRFQYYDDSDADELKAATKALINALRHDDSPEVRRAALLNLAKTKHTMPALMERARDVNVINRRLVYSRVSRELPPFADLDLALKEEILKWGLNDREESVSSAAKSLILAHWLPQVDDNILAFLEHVQVVDSDAMPLVMNVIFEHRRDRFSAITIPREFWKELTVERAFFIRSFFDFCVHNNLFESIDQNIPELTRLLLVVQEYLRLRTSILAANAALEEEYRSYHGKKENLRRLVDNGLGEPRDLKRKMDKVEAAVAEMQNAVAGLDARILKTRGQIKACNATTRKARGNLLQPKLDALAQELEVQTAEKNELARVLREHTAALAELEVQLKEAEKAQHHRETERDKFLENTGDLERRYLPLGDQKKDLEFVIEQILCVIKGCDFADVAGTRRLMPIVTSALTNDKLNERNVAICVRILRKASLDENYFSQLCTEIITDIRDSALGENDETFVSAASLFGDDGGNGDDMDEDDDMDENSQNRTKTDTEAPLDREDSPDALADDNPPEKRLKIAPALPPDHLLIHCLTVLQYYLEVAEDTKCNSYQLDTLIDTLIRPALVNNKNTTIRFLGYKTLGLFSLIDEGLGASNLKFFGISASKAHEEDLKALCMQIIFDIVSSHGVRILDIDGEDAVDSLSLARLFYRLLKNPEMPRLQAVVAEGLCKLFLADLLVDFGRGEVDGADDDTLQEMQLLLTLVMAYFHPANADNQELRQVLAFCIPVYCFSHTEHQIKISSVSGDVFYCMFRTDSDFAAHDTLVPALTVLQQLIYWCDPRNVIHARPETVEKSTSHFWQALKLLQIIEQDSPKPIKRLIINSLARLSLSEHLGSEALKGLVIAINDTRAHIETHKNDPGFSLDMTTERNFDKFLAFVRDLAAKAEELELQGDRGSATTSRATSRSSSRAGSRTPSRSVSRQPSRELSVGPRAVVLSEGAADARESEGTPDTDANVQQKLEHIDKMLAEEADVEYSDVE